MLKNMDDMNDSLGNFWNTLAEKPNSTVRFFNRQDYYSVHFDDAEMLARCFYKSLEILKYFGNSRSSPYINIKKTKSDKVFRYLLIANQYKVEVYVLNKQSDEKSWSLDFVATPGNLEKYREILFNDRDLSSSNSLLALNIKKINDNYKVYLGFCDLDNGILMIGGFQESYTGYDHLTNLSSALFQLNCRECLIPSNDNRPELIALKKTVQNSGLLLSEVKKTNFAIENMTNSLLKLICKVKYTNESSILKLCEIEGLESVGCLGAVVTYLELLNDETYQNSFDIQTFKLHNFMLIGEQSGHSLNILPSANDLRKTDSLYGLLNSCRTVSGERLLMQWIKQPLMDANLINNRLDIVESLVTDNNLRSSLYDDNLRRIADILRITKKIQRKKANLQDVYKLFVSLVQAKEILNLLSEHEGPHKHLLDSEFISVIKEILSCSENFIQMFKSIFDFEAVKKHEYKIKYSVDENLEKCDAAIQSLVVEMETEKVNVAHKLMIEPGKLKLESSNNIGYFMRVVRKDESILRNKNYINIIETLKEGVKFHSTKMALLNEKFVEYRALFWEYEKCILDEIYNSTTEYIGQFHQLTSVIAKLDVLCSLAVTTVGASGPYVRPKIIDSGKSILKLTNCRHPLLEMQCNVSFIPNDVLFNDNQTFNIITGPNMGGKSTYIRSIGLACVMAQIGSFVPCDEAEMSLCDRVITRIGAGDCQLAGISTFMAEMLDVSWILKTATSKSLIIIDELGRGTSTFDGFGLAWAISEHLAKDLRAFSVFATHFHELTNLDQKHANVKNLHVSAKTIDKNLIFLYKVENGPSLKSYGIEVAVVSGLPDCVIEVAKLKLTEYESVKEMDNHGVDNLENQRLALIEFCKVDLDKKINFDEFVMELSANV